MSFERLRELFDRIAEMPMLEREAEILRSTAGDPELEHELRALLAHAEREETTLDNATLFVAGWEQSPLPVIPGFRVHRRIGRGGSATVYLADQERADFTRPVALKVVDSVIDSASLWRVREEQRILARLEHPGIARLYDTGLTSLGQPYLVMEHVEGESIVEHCRSRNLSIRERIALFLGVLDAVSYAHERGIVHRDLKPANILVSARGEPKLLDFGIAKLVAPEGEDETVTLHRAMTPAYASPEQRRGGRITPASDIYSLGVVLYELLANTIPFRMHTIPELDPEPPSAAFEGDAKWRGTLRGDLDAVVLKALRYKPEDRYASAAALADDLRRVLAGRPVAARRGDRIYRTGKFIRRHRPAVAAVIAAVMVATFFVAFRQQTSVFHRPELALFYEADSRLLRDGARKLESFDAVAARDIFRRAVASSPDEPLAWDGLARAESALGEAGRAAEASRRAGALLASAETSLPPYEVERIRATAFAANHDWAKAIPALERLFVRQPERVDVGMTLVYALLASGRTEAADSVLARLRQLRADDPQIDLLDAEVALQFSEFQRAAAVAARVRERAQKLGAGVLALRAERVHAEAIGRIDRRDEAQRALASLAKRADAAGLVREAAAARLELGTLMTRSGSPEETRAVLEAALAGARAAGDVRGQIMARSMLALLAGKRGELAEAIKSNDVAVAEARRVGDRWAEGFVLSSRLALLNWSDDLAATEPTIDPTLTALRESGNRQVLMSTLGNQALVAIENLDLLRAEAYLVEAEALGRRVGSPLASSMIDRSRGYLEETRGDYELARERYTSAVEKARHARAPVTVGQYLSDLAWIEVFANRPDAAEPRIREAMAMLTAAGDSRAAQRLEVLLAWTDARRGDIASAQKRLEVRRKAVAESGSAGARFSLIGVEARVAIALGDWRRAVELRREMVRMATEWNMRGVMIQQQAALAEALHGAGDRRALEKLVAELLPEVKRLGLHGIERDLRALIST